MQLSELISAYYEAIPHASKEHEWILFCPFCQSNGHVGASRQTLGVNVLKEVGHCHRCDWRGSGRNLFSQLADEVSVNEDYNPGEDYEVEQKKEKPTTYSLKRVRLPREFESLWEDVNDRVGKKARQYLYDRGITPEQIRKHKIGFAAVGKYTGRIILPIIYRKAIVGFTARSFQGSEPKYLIAPGTKFLYGYPTKRKEACILVEGPFDKLNIERYISDYDCIGGQGSALTDLQIHALAKYKKIVLWNDPDEAGVVGVTKEAKILKQETNCEIFGIKPVKNLDVDPGDMTEKQVLKCMANIRPWSQTLISQLKVSVFF